MVASELEREMELFAPSPTGAGLGYAIPDLAWYEDGNEEPVFA